MNVGVQATAPNDRTGASRGSAETASGLINGVRRRTPCLN